MSTNIPDKSPTSG